MKLSIVPISQTSAEAITGWRYDPPYDCYNLEYPPTAEAMAYFLDPTYAYHELRDETAALVGFCCFGIDAQVLGGDYSSTALDIGMGMRPDLTGRGWGRIFATAVIAFAETHYAPQPLRVTIATFNHRAQRVWSGLGFQPVEHFGRTGDGMTFVIQVRP